MSREQYDWLDRKGVDVNSYEYLKQDDKRVYLIRRDIGQVIYRKKQKVGWIF